MIQSLISQKNKCCHVNRIREH